MNPQRIAQLKAMMLHDHGDPFLPYALGQEYMSGGEWQDAIRQFASCAHDFPDYLPVYYHWGLALVKAHLIEDAVEVLRRGFKLAREQKDGKTANEIEALLEDLD